MSGRKGGGLKPLLVTMAILAGLHFAVNAACERPRPPIPPPGPSEPAEVARARRAAKPREPGTLVLQRRPIRDR